MPIIQSEPDAISRAYAQGLFDLVFSIGGREAVEETLGEIDSLGEVSRADPKFGEFLASRIVSIADRDKVLRTILKGRCSDHVLNFVLILNLKGRLGWFRAIVESFDSLVQHAFGRIEVDVYTASPMTKEDSDAISKRLREVLGREPVVHAYTDPKLIGGVRLQIGDQLIDASIMTALRKIREQMNDKGPAEVRAASERLFGIDPSSNGH